VLEREPALPAGIEVRAQAMENFGPRAPLGRWAGGFAVGQLLVEDVWSPFLAAAPDPETLDATLGSLNVTLTFFTSRELARKWLRKARARRPTTALAPRTTPSGPR
jgi:hypothetical protein